MFVKRKRINNPEKYLTLIKKNDSFYIGHEINKELEELLIKLGFSEKLAVGEILLPSIVGKISQFNAEGKEKIRKDLPKETVYYPREWNVKDWGGNEHSGVSYMPYERFPREAIPPPSIELQIIKNKTKKFLISPVLKNIEKNYPDIKHVMNLFLEVFKEMEILKDDMTSPVGTKVIRLNWEILPPGINPWSRVKEHIKNIIEKSSAGEKFMINERFDLIKKHNPEQVAIGLAGFSGYIVFKFKNKKNYFLESIKYNNATYVFGKKWEELSKMTKAEILQNNFHEERVIHNDKWSEKISTLLK